MNKDFPGHVYMDTVEDGFLFLATHYSGINQDDDNDWYGEQRQFLDKSVTNMKFHLFKTSPGDLEDEGKHHWSSGGKYCVGSRKVCLVVLGFVS